MFAWFIIFFDKSNVPPKSQIASDLYKNPKQSQANIKPFKITKEKIAYTVTPVAGYELYGLVVLYNDNEAYSDVAHKSTGDYLNTRNLCVVWGANIKSEAYLHVNYKNNDVTCFATTSSEQEGWLAKFKNENFSNNHILPSNNKLYELIKSVRSGDQIYLKGYLVNYGAEKWLKKTSLTRMDLGNNSSEVIWVTEFKMLKRGHMIPRAIIKYCIYSLISCFILLVTLYIFKPKYHQEGMIPLEHYAPTPFKPKQNHDDNKNSPWQKWGI